MHAADAQSKLESHKVLLCSLKQGALQVVRDSLGLLISLMGAWVAILDEIARGEIAEVSLPGTLRFDLPRIEGAALACLCSCHPEVSTAQLAVCEHLCTLGLGRQALGARCHACQPWHPSKLSLLHSKHMEWFTPACVLPAAQAVHLHLLCCTPQVRGKALETLNAARVLDRGLAASSALEAGEPLERAPQQLLYLDSRSGSWVVHEPALTACAIP